MSTYKTVLPQIFEYSVSVSIANGRACVAFLMNNDSSFAVTVDDLPGRIGLWLSEISYRDLEKAGLL